MGYLIDREKYKSAYIALYALLKKDIVDNIYPYGSKLPSKRILAAETGLSVITVKNAYELLCEEGYVESVERSGYYVIFKSEDGFVQTGQVQLHSRIATGQELTFPYSVLARTMRHVMSDYQEDILDASPNCGREELREAIRVYLARNRDIHVDLNQIIIGSGAEYLYSMIVGILGNEAIYALESPSYEKIEKIYRTAGVTCDMLPLGADGIQSEALAKTGATVMHVSPYRSYPTGIKASASKRFEYIRWAKRPGHYLVEDDYESEFSVSNKPEETLFALSKDDNVIYINTFSKTISPSLRMGYMVLPKHLVERYEQRLGFYSCTVPTFEQLVIASLITNGDFERHINRVRRDKRRKSMT
ncbi:MAG: PLP-dependent aminotransferase family protein [Agathobacter sp.]|uniref:MocR-like pyridoxine biosynthesis transcription factor PdxR n=1 Tax=Agathobacter sp. TaxID=2021311 RepID=UPI00258ADF32|nr:PLP-dependent aminotransferase family protein [Agathobacter sp.]MCR5678496.1 PLP-dependent aminotransferase family protein [Agathobacter sp.]